MYIPNERFSVDFKKSKNLNITCLDQSHLNRSTKRFVKTTNRRTSTKNFCYQYNLQPNVQMSLFSQSQNKKVHISSQIINNNTHSVILKNFLFVFLKSYCKSFLFRTQQCKGYRQIMN